MSTGLATSFFNDKNKNIVKNLLELLTESKQEIPTWLSAIGENARSGSGISSRRTGQKKYGGGGNFSSRDYRQGGQGGRSGNRGGQPMVQSNNYGGGYGMGSMYSSMGGMGGSNDGGAYQKPNNGNDWW